MTVTIAPADAPPIAAALSANARTTEEEEEAVAGTAVIAVTTCVQGVTVMIAPVDAMMTAARMVARGAGAKVPRFMEI